MLTNKDNLHDLQEEKQQKRRAMHLNHNDHK